MKRVISCLLLVVALLTGMTGVYAAEPEMKVQVLASQTEAKVGDTVEYTVMATGSGVVAMQFTLKLPAGLSYVPNSAKTPEKLAEKLGVPAADWTEQSMMFTFYNDIGITFAEGTEILRFSCVAEKEGTWEVELYELLPFDSEFMEFEPTLQTQIVHVTVEESQNTGSFTGNASDNVTADSDQNITPEAALSPESTDLENEVTTGTDTQENPEHEVVEDLSAGSNESGKNETDDSEKEVTAPQNSKNWIVLGSVGAVLVCGVVILVLIKKKRV